MLIHVRVSSKQISLGYLFVLEAIQWTKTAFFTIHLKDIIKKKKKKKKKNSSEAYFIFGCARKD